MDRALRTFARSCVLLALVSTLGVRATGASGETIASEQELDAAIRRLDDVGTRMDALATLIRFASSRLYQVGSVMMFVGDGLDNLRGRAVEAVSARADVDTVGRALDAADRELQFWGLWCWRSDVDEPDGPAKDRWSALIPKIERLAIDGDEGIRGQAVERLMRCPQERPFLEKRLGVETSAWIVSRLVHDDDRAERSRRTNVQLRRLLSSPDAEARRSALVLIGAQTNPSIASVYLLDFDLSVFDLVVRATRSRSDEERADAAYALTELRPLDPDRSRAVFLGLASDPSADVRWRVAYGLAGEFERADVRPVIAALLDDPSPSVEYMTILAVDPARFVDRLERLARCADPTVAEWASATLEQLRTADRPSANP